jgi:hypothetical protein
VKIGRYSGVLAVVCLGLLGCGDRAARTHVVYPTAPARCPVLITGMGSRSPGEAQRFDARVLLGMHLDRAVDVARRHGCQVRANVRNGHRPPETLDVQSARINVRVDDGIVVALDFDGRSAIY